MSKKVKFTFDVIITDDEKKELALAEPTKGELQAQESDRGEIIYRRSSKRKVKILIALVVMGMLLTGLGGYAIASFVNRDRVIEVDQDEEIENVIEYENLYPVEMSKQLSEFPTDSTTREILERGFFYELDNIVEDGDFKMELVAATGDIYKPMMLLNIHVADETIVAQNDKIEVYAYCLEESIYETDIEHYGQWNAYGVQDKSDPHIYHVTLPSGVFLSNGGSVVFDLTKIRLGSQKSQWKEYDVSLKETLSIPYDIAFFQPCTIENYGLEFETEHKTYKLNWTEIGFYDTYLQFSYDLEDATSENTYYTSDLEQWYAFINGVTLQINGVEYRVDPTVNAYINMSEDKTNPYYHVWARFPGVTDNRIDSVIIRYRDTEYRLK